ncbi:hypothetical protein ACFLQR_02225 [Verrucomicrobiota bacterium]
MHTMQQRNAVVHVLSAILFVVVFLGLGGCEGDTNEDTAGVDSYFASNPYSSEAREEPGEPDLTIDPVFETTSIVGETIVFAGQGGTGPYTWSVSASDYGYIEVIGWSEAVYTCVQVGNNDVIVQDAEGHTATAHITPAEDSMTISPSEIDLIGDAYYAAFSVSGGTPPYTWSVGNVGMGSISYSADTSYTAGYTGTGVLGVNMITVVDAEGRTASAMLTQSSLDEE